MAVPLLTTKLAAPSPRPNRVPRPQLTRRLDEGLEAGHRLTFVSAPAGFGKTTLIGEWVQGGGRPVAWISLDEGDSDLVQFVSYLAAALQHVDPAIGGTLQHIVGSPQTPALQDILTVLVNDISAAGVPFILTLDDYHHITSAPVHGIIQLLLEHQPPPMHLVIITREDPPLPLPRLRARGQVTEVRERDLRLTPEEAAEFLNQTMGLRLSAGAVAALEARTEGWIAGLQLAALALQESEGEDGTEAFIASFTGNNRYIMDYLVSEVLERQPEPVRDFLRQTAILDQMNAPLCQAVTGSADSQAILERLEATNLFLIPLDHHREWYRYHQLFAGVLRTTVRQDERRMLHRRAAEWHEAHDLPRQAIQHALACGVGPEDLGYASQLIAGAAEETIHRGHVQTVRGWLDALPDEQVRADGELATFRAWVCGLSGALDRAGEYADCAEAALRRGDAPEAALARLSLLRAMIAMARRDYESAIPLAAHALEAFAEAQARWRLLGLWVMSESEERMGRIADAIQTLRRAAQVGQELGNLIFAAAIEAFLAAALNHHGQRLEAVAVCERAIDRYTGEAGQVSPVAGLIYSWLGRLHYEADDLELARTCLEKGMALCRQVAAGGLLSFPYGAMAPLLHAQGDRDGALEALRRAYQVAGEESLGDANWVPAWEVNLHLLSGDLAAARRWAETTGLQLDEAPQYLRFETHLTVGRVLIAEGRHAEALAWLERLEAYAREHGLVRWLLTVRILQSLAADGCGDRAGALDYLRQAAEMAAPQGYVRAFLDEDSRVVGLLGEVRHAAPAFVDGVLEAATGVPRPVSQHLIEPLSERELEVLSLIATGHSNAEIADKLVIATGTVKRHINNIYGKLDVVSRTQALAKARTLRLLGS